MAEITRIQAPAAPNLPVAPTEYSQGHEDVMSNVLRLYFNRLDQAMTALLGDTGGRFLQFPYFSGYQDGYTTLSSTINNSDTAITVASTEGFDTSGFIIMETEVAQYTGKTATTFTGLTRGAKGTTAASHNAGVYVTDAAGVSAGSSAAIKLDTVTISKQVSCTVPDSRIYFNGAGIYNIQFSAQLLNFTTSDDNVTIWLRKNGTDIAATAGIQQVNSKHGSSPGASIVAWNFVDQFSTDDYIELYWTSDTGDTVLATYPPGAAPVHPASPGVIVTVTFVSALQA